MKKLLLFLFLMGCTTTTPNVVSFEPNHTELIDLGSSPELKTIYFDDVVLIKIVGYTNVTLTLEIFFLYSKAGKIISEIPIEKTIVYEDKEGSSLKISWEKHTSYEMFVESFYSMADILKE